MSYNFSPLLHKILTYLIALVWLINGLFCKVLNLVPRHQLIVKTILNLDNASAFYLTKVIGVLEILMAVWILSRIKSKLNALVQIVIIIAMNLLEHFMAPDLLLWGKFNLVFAVLFCGVIFYNEFILNKKLTSKI